MIRNLKTLGLALCAVLALTAVMASAASAGSYTAASYPASGTASSAFGNDTLTFPGGGTVQCAVHFTGTLSEASSHLLVTPVYSGNPNVHCSFGPFTAGVSMNGCQYTFENPAKVAAGHYTAPVQVVCPAGKSILITIPATGPAICEVEIGNQTPSGGVTLKNNAAGDVDVQANVSGIKYNVPKDGFGCPFSGLGERSDATYIQHAAITFDSAVNISVSG